MQRNKGNYETIVDSILSTNGVPSLTSIGLWEEEGEEQVRETP